MSALAMILMVAMVIPASGPEMVSGETRESRLDMSGEWMGTWQGDKWLLKVSFDGEVLCSPPGRNLVEIPCTITDLGDGVARMEHDGPVYQGSYRAEGDKVIFHFHPVNFQSKGTVLILHRVKPRK